MKHKKDWSWVKLLIAFGIGLFFFIKSCYKDKYIQQEGVTRIVVVSYYDMVRFGKSDYRKYSFGYFQVGYKKYKAYTDTIAPEGTKFEIKYNPKDPKEWRRTKRIVRE